MQKRWPIKTWQTICAIVLVLCFAIFLLLPIMQPEPTTIADIAYDARRSRRTDFRIFIEENGIYVPYLVLTADYGGNVLLLREYLLDRSMPFNQSLRGDGFWGANDFGAYYPYSHIDKFLNTEFMETLGATVLAAMVPSDIVVTDRRSWEGGGRYV